MLKAVSCAIVLLLVLAACGPGPQEQDNAVCTNDVKQCPDGSYVSRVPPDCSFQYCPSDSSEEPNSCANDFKECPDGSFVARSGEDCVFEKCPKSDKPPEVCDFNEPYKRFVLKDPDACSRARFACEPGEEAFVNDCGCGCISEPSGPGNSEEILCRDEDRSGQICTNDYLTVCGFRGDGSMIDYPNSCKACDDPQVFSYIEGTCVPKSSEYEGFYSSSSNN